MTKRVVDVCVVDRGAANTDKVARNLHRGAVAPTGGVRFQF